MSDPDAPRFFTIKPNLLGGRFFFYFGPWDRWEAIREWYRSNGPDDPKHRIKDHRTHNDLPDDEHYDGMVIDPSPGFPLLMMLAVPHTPAEIGNLTHEIHHAVQRWTEGLGIFTSRESEEIFAYTEGKLVELVLEYLWHGQAGEGLEPGDQA